MSSFKKFRLSKKIAGILAVIAICSFNNAMAKENDKNYGSRWAQKTVTEFINKGYISSKEKFEVGDYITLTQASNISNEYLKRINQNSQAIKLDLSIYSDAQLFDYLTNDYYITREEFAYMLCKTLDIKPVKNNKIVFDDDNEISEKAKGYIYALEEKGIILGYPDKNYKPKKRITNAEFVTILNRSKSLAITAFEAKEKELNVSGDNNKSGEVIVSGDLDNSGEIIISSELLESGERIVIEDDKKALSHANFGDSIEKITVSGNTISSEELIKSGEVIKLDSNKEKKLSGEKAISEKQTEEDSGFTLNSDYLVTSGNITKEDIPVDVIDANELVLSGENILLDNSGDEQSNDEFVDKGRYKIKTGNDFSAGIAYYISNELHVVDIDESISTIKGAKMDVVFTMPYSFENSDVFVVTSDNSVVTWNSNTRELKAVGYGEAFVKAMIPTTNYELIFKITVEKSI